MRSLAAFVVAAAAGAAAAATFGPGTHGGCESEGWMRQGAYCYYVDTLPAPMSWGAGETWCNDLTAPVNVTNPDNSTTLITFTDTAHLASFHSPNEMADFTSRAGAILFNSNSPDYDFWMGCSPASGGGAAWLWSDATPFYYANWRRAGTLQPDPTVTSPACVLHLDTLALTNAWSVAAATSNKRPLCKRRAKDASCPLGWSAANGRCYFAQQDAQRTATVAAQECALLGGALATLDSAAVATGVMDDVLWESLDTAFHVGAVRDYGAPGGFRWTANAAVLGTGASWPQWMANQPANLGGVQDTLVVGKGPFPTFTGLADVDGSVDHRSYLCEALPITAQPYDLALLPPSQTTATAWPQTDPCPAGWVISGVHCHKALRFSTATSFADASAACKAENSNADLGAIPGPASATLQRSLYLALPSASVSDIVWTGVKYDGTAGEWLNHNGEPYDSVHPLTTAVPSGDAWLSFPNPLDDVTATAYIVEGAGVLAQGAVCAMVQDSDPLCPRGWRAGSNGDCFFAGLHTFFQAQGQAHCAAVGGNLADVGSVLDAAVLAQLVPPLDMSGAATPVWVSPVSGSEGPRFGPVNPASGAGTFANFTLVNVDSSPLVWSSWGAYFPDSAVFDTPVRVQFSPASQRYVAQRFPVQAEAAYVCRASSGAAQPYTPPPVLGGGGTTTATTGTSLTTTEDDDTFLQGLGYVDRVYRQDDPCPISWLPFNSWCYKAVDPGSSFSYVNAQTACTNAHPDSLLAAVGTPAENEVVSALAALTPGQRAWIGCEVGGSPTSPNYGHMYLSDGSPAKQTFFGAGFDDSQVIPGAKCYMERSAGGVGTWGLDPTGAAGNQQYGAVCTLRAIARTENGAAACPLGLGLGWRYIKDDNDSPGYCVTALHDTQDQNEAAAACDAVGSKLAGVADFTQNRKLAKFMTHPLPSAVATWWLGVSRPTSPISGADCGWVTTATGTAAPYTNWEVPDPSGTTCLGLPQTAFLRTTTEKWGATDSNALDRGAVCKLSLQSDFGAMFAQNPRGLAAFVPPARAAPLLQAALTAPGSTLPPGFPPCAALQAFADKVFFVVLTATDGQGWAAGWTATLNKPNGATQVLSHPTSGYSSQQYLCMPTSSTTCPTITVRGGTPGTGGNIVVSVYYADLTATPAQLVAHANGDDATAAISIPGLLVCAPSPSPTPANPPAGTPSPSPSPTPSGTPPAPSPSGSPSVTPSASTPVQVASSSPSPSSDSTPGASPSAGGTPGVTPSTASTPTSSPAATAVSTPTASVTGSPQATPTPTQSPAVTPSSASTPAPPPSTSASPSPSPSTGSGGGGGGNGAGGGSGGTADDDVTAAGGNAGSDAGSGNAPSGDTGVVVGVVITVVIVVAAAAVYWYRSGNKDEVKTIKAQSSSGGTAVGQATIVHSIPLPPGAGGMGVYNTQNPLQRHGGSNHRMSRVQAQVRSAPIGGPPAAYPPPGGQHAPRKDSWL